MFHSPRIRAALVLLALAAIGLAAVRTGQRIQPIKARVSDITTYHAMVDRLRAGEGYYDAIGGELRRWGYATREVFNWRTPLLMTFEASVSNSSTQRLLMFLTGALCAITLTVVSGWKSRLLAVSMQLGMMALFAGSDSYVMSEPWAGVLIALSIGAYRTRQSAVGVGLGLLALFVRELAAPYCVVCTVIAGLRRRRRELTAWIAGAAAYFGYYAWHISQVLAHRLPDDISHASSWLALGGIASLVTKVHWQGWLVLGPMWLSALALVLIVAGVADRQSDVRARATSAAYLVFFLTAGQPFDWYWGLVAWPTWTFVIAGGVRTIVASVRTAAAGTPGARTSAGYASH